MTHVRALCKQYRTLQTFVTEKLSKVNVRGLSSSVYQTVCIETLMAQDGDRHFLRRQCVVCRGSKTLPPLF